MVKRIIVIVGLLSITLLSGCAKEGPGPFAPKAFVVQSPLARQAALDKIKYWRISGAFSIQQEGHNPEMASFTWWQSDRTYRISILSVLDLYRVDIYRMNGIVKLWKNGTLSLTAPSPEELLEEAMGWSLPISDLRYWIIGMPAPQKHGKFLVKYDEYGHLSDLKQDGWTLHFGSYKRQIDAPDFPKRITLSHPGIDQVRPAITVKIVVKEWQLMMEHYYAPDTTV